MSNENQPLPLSDRLIEFSEGGTLNDVLQSGLKAQIELITEQNGFDEDPTNPEYQTSKRTINHLTMLSEIFDNGLEGYGIVRSGQEKDGTYSWIMAPKDKIFINPRSQKKNVNTRHGAVYQVGFELSRFGDRSLTNQDPEEVLSAMGVSIEVSLQIVEYDMDVGKHSITKEDGLLIRISRNGAHSVYGRKYAGYINYSTDDALTLPDTPQDSINALSRDINFLGVV